MVVVAVSPLAAAVRKLPPAQGLVVSCREHKREARGTPFCPDQKLAIVAAHLHGIVVKTYHAQGLLCVVRLPDKKGAP